MMEKFLLSILLEDQAAGGESILNTIKFAVLPIAKVFTVCFMVFLLASRYVCILPANGRKLLNGLVFSLLLPCLIFSQLDRAIAFQKVLEWCYIPVNVIVGSISGSLIGLLVATIIQPPYRWVFLLKPVTVIIFLLSVFGNIGSTPPVLIAALCRNEYNPFGDTNKCNESGNAYISFGQWVGAIIVYKSVFQMLAPPNGETFDNADEKKLSTMDTATFESLPSKASLPKAEKILTKVSFKDDIEKVPLLPSVDWEMGSSTSRKVIAKILFLLEKLK